MFKVTRRDRRTKGQRGVSLMEVLVTIAIIGILSLVTIPAFNNFQRRNTVKRGLRAFTADLRGFRQLAITKNRYLRVEFLNSRDYQLFQSNDNGATWNPLKVGVVESKDSVHTLPQTLEFRANTFNDSDADNFKDIDFRPDGSVGDFTGSTAAGGSVTLKTDWQYILNNVVVDLSPTGQIKTTESNKP